MSSSTHNRRAVAFLIASVNSFGSLTTCQVPLPKKNKFVKPEKTDYGVERKHDYKALSEQIAKKVAEVQSLKKDNQKYKQLINRHALANVDKMFDKLIKNSIPD